MTLFQNLYYLLYSLFERMTFRTKPDIESIENGSQEYEFIILSQPTMIR